MSQQSHTRHENTHPTPDASYVAYARYLLSERDYSIPAAAGRIDRITPNDMSKSTIFAIVNQADAPDDTHEHDQSPDADHTTTSRTDTETTTSSDDKDTDTDTDTTETRIEDEPGASSWSAN